MNLHIPEYFFGASLAAELLLLGAILLLIWFAVARMSAPRRERMTSAIILTVGLLGWFALATYLGRQNVYWAPNSPDVPTIVFGVLVPILIGLPLLMRSARMARVIDALPLSWLVGVQFYRVLGAIFLVAWSDGYLPWQFALPAGIGDVATGIFAVAVAVMLAKNSWRAPRAAYVWCLFGIADLVVALGLGAMTSPGRINVLALDSPNLLVSAYPMVMIPTFAVPVSIILHGVTLWKLRRLYAQTRTGQAARA